MASSRSLTGLLPGHRHVGCWPPPPILRPDDVSLRHCAGLRSPARRHPHYWHIPSLETHRPSQHNTSCHAKQTRTMIIIVIKLHSVQCVVTRVDVPVYDGRSRQCLAAGDRNRGKTRDIWTRVTSPAVNTAGNSGYNFGSLTFIHTHISG